MDGIFLSVCTHYLSQNGMLITCFIYRFIPSRSSQDIDLSHFAIMKDKGENEENDPDLSPSKAPYQSQLNNVLNKGDNPQDTKILSFNNKCPAATGTSLVSAFLYMNF